MIPERGGGALQHYAQTRAIHVPIGEAGIFITAASLRHPLFFPLSAHRTNNQCQPNQRLPFLWQKIKHFPKGSQNIWVILFVQEGHEILVFVSLTENIPSVG